MQGKSTSDDNAGLVGAEVVSLTVTRTSTRPPAGFRGRRERVQVCRWKSRVASRHVKPRLAGFETVSERLISLRFLYALSHTRKLYALAFIRTRTGGVGCLGTAGTACADRPQQHGPPNDSSFSPYPAPVVASSPAPPLFHGLDRIVASGGISYQYRLAASTEGRYISQSAFVESLRMSLRGPLLPITD
jgi:hypothetical protein